MSGVEMYLNHLQRIAFEDYIAAKTLYELGFVRSAFTLSQYSLEKYLKVIWARRKNYSKREELVKDLKNLFGHGIPKIFEKLDEQDKRKLQKKVVGVRVILQSAIRYGEQPWGFNKADLPKQLEFIRACRTLLDERTAGSNQSYRDLERWIDQSVLPSGNKRVKEKHDELLKEIWSYRRNIKRLSKSKLRNFHL